jgi:hypothetical protein
MNRPGLKPARGTNAGIREAIWSRDTNCSGAARSKSSERGGRWEDDREVARQARRAPAVARLHDAQPAQPAQAGDSCSRIPCDCGWVSQTTWDFVVDPGMRLENAILEMDLSKDCCTLLSCLPLHRIAERPDQIT